MAGRTVEITIAGETCRVVTSADERELERLVGIVEQKLGEVLQQGRPLTTKAVLLTAIALAHELDTQRSRAEQIASKARKALEGLLARVDRALELSDTCAKDRENRNRKKGGATNEREAALTPPDSQPPSTAPGPSEDAPASP